MLKSRSAFQGSSLENVLCQITKDSLKRNIAVDVKSGAGRRIDPNPEVVTSMTSGCGGKGDVKIMTMGVSVFQTTRKKVEAPVISLDSRVS